MVAGPVHALNALVPVDDLEDLTDEGTGLLSSILAQGGRQSAQDLSSGQGTLIPFNSVRRLVGPYTYLWALWRAFPIKIIWPSSGFWTRYRVQQQL